MKYTHRERGIALLITLLIMSVLLGVTASLLNVSLKQFQLSNVAKDSEIAFQAASAGMECMLSHDYEQYPYSIFNVNGDGTGTTTESDISCMGQTSNDSVAGDGDTLPTGVTQHAGQVDNGEEQRFKFSWKNDIDLSEVCSEVSIYKFFSTNSAVSMSVALGPSDTCPAGITCTVIKARGYNVACNNIGTQRTIERELVQRY